MSHERDSLSEQTKLDELEISFKKLLEESKEELVNLRKQITTGEGIFDPIIQKKKELFVRIKLIRRQLKEQWNHLPKQEKAQSVDKKPGIGAAKNKLITMMQELKDIIFLIKNLTVNAKNKEQEKAAKEQIRIFNKNTEAFYNEISKVFEEYQSLEINIHRITTLKYGENISDYMNYTTATLKALVTAGLAWFSTLGEAAQAAGSIFYPISATFTSSAKLFSFLGRTTQFFIASNEASKEEISELRKLELDDTKALLKKSAAFKFLAFSFSALSALAFAGVLATPIGWGFVAAATLVDWIDDGLGASQRANKALKKFSDEYEEKLAKNDPDTLNEFNMLQEKANQAKLEAQWGFANAIAMVLIACGPIPLVGPFLGLAGLATFGVVSVRNTYVAAKPYVEKYLTAAARYFSTEKPKQEQELTAVPTPTPAPEKKQEAAVEASVRVAPQFTKILNSQVAQQELEKVSLSTSTKKSVEKSTPSAAIKSPRLFKKAAANDKSLSPTETPEINKKIRQSSTTTSHNPSIIKGG